MSVNRSSLLCIALIVALCLVQTSCAATKKSTSKAKPKTATASKSGNSSKTKSAPKKSEASKTKADPKKASVKSAPKALPKLVDLGASKCIPCRMMVPILEELKREYRGSLEVVFIDVWENKDAAEKYGIQSIPTQIFYDAKGKEFFRHVGFFPKEEILETFRKQGIKLTTQSTATKKAGK